jgi:hypothetical protein
MEPAQGSTSLLQAQGALEAGQLDVDAAVMVVCMNTIESLSSKVMRRLARPW